MSRAARKLPALRIKRSVFEKLVMYGLSRHEFGAILLGRGNVVTEICRIRNVDPLKRDYFEWDKKQRSVKLRRAKERGLKLIAESHSHPSEDHPERPSSLDRQYFDRSVPHIVVHSKTMTLSAWDLVLNQRVELTVI